jgi:hypothetical protein
MMPTFSLNITFDNLEYVFEILAMWKKKEILQKPKCLFLVKNFYIL